MSGIEDVFGTSRNRPDHPDFWRISEIVLQNDGAIEDLRGPEREKVWERIVDEVADRNSVLYMAYQRTIRTIPPTYQGAERIELMGRIMRTWVDAFIVGAQFQARGGHQPSAPVTPTP